MSRKPNISVNFMTILYELVPDSWLMESMKNRSQAIKPWR